MPTHTPTMMNFPANANTSITAEDGVMLTALVATSRHNKSKILRHMIMATLDTIDDANDVAAFDEAVDALLERRNAAAQRSATP